MINLKKRIAEFSLIILLVAFVTTGCSNRFNQTGSWLVGSDSTLLPRAFDSDSIQVKLTTSQVDIGLTNGSDTVLCLGMVPWAEADMLLQFYSIDSVYYATQIISANVILRRANYLLQADGSNPAAYDVHGMSLEGFPIDSSWSTASVAWDSVQVLPKGNSNIVLSSTSYVNDTTVVIPLDTGIVRQWAIASQDTNYKNYGFILKPQMVGGVLSVYSGAYAGTGFEPTIQVACIINGIPDTVTSTSSYSTYVANTTALTPPPQTFALQSGTGLHRNLLFDLDTIPAFSIVNYATLTLHSNPKDTLYSGQSVDSLTAYYETDPSTFAIGSSGISLSSRAGNTYTLPVTLIVQQMLNHTNYGFIITRYEDNNNLDTRFIYDQSAPDSLKPRLSIVYTPVVKKKR